MTSPRLGLTLGDPDGIGPELAVSLLATRPQNAGDTLLLIGPKASLDWHAQRLGVQLPGRSIGLHETGGLAPGVYYIEPKELAGFAPTPGTCRVEGGAAAGYSLQTALDLQKKGVFDSLVTLPLNKATFNAAGFHYSGHTEMLATFWGLGRDEVCMHLCGPRLRVSLVTTHPPLKDVASLLSPQRILRCLKQTDAFVRAIGAHGPIAVCGLNPHAGESGTIGDEEARLIEPAIVKAQELGIAAMGPYPGDTIFYRAAQGDFSAVLAMYHDQGLAPLKLLHFHEAVNVTLGLPKPRTSVDHGTAYDLVGTGKASRDSLDAALELGRKLGAASAAG